MPYEEFRKLFEQRPEPSRWQRITLGSSIKWALAGGRAMRYCRAAGAVISPRLNLSTPVSAQEDCHEMLTR